MSSKEQLKEALKRRDKTIRELKETVGKLNSSLGRAETAVKTIATAMEIVEAVKRQKKWWQFWKRYAD